MGRTDANVLVVGKRIDCTSNNESTGNSETGEQGVRSTVGEPGFFKAVGFDLVLCVARFEMRQRR